MTKVSGGEPLPEHPKERPQPRIIEWLLRVRAKGIRSPHFWIISGLMAGLAYVYYGVLTAYHDVYVILFFYPLIYAAVVYRMRGVIGTGVVFLGILFSHSLFFAGDPYSLARSLLFAIFAFLISGLIATQLDYLERQLEAYREIFSLNETLSSYIRQVLSLNEALGGYIERLESTQKQLIQAEKLNALGQLAASVAHEINNPLAGALLYSKLLLRKLRGDSFDKTEALTNLSKVESAVSYCSRVVRNLLDFARQSQPVLRPLAVSTVIDQAMSLVGHQAQMRGVKITREETSPLLLVMADPDQLQQVFMNLMLNAIQAMPDGGQLAIRTSLGKDGQINASVQDTGCGIAAENLDKLFTPFFTTKEKGEGSGLGLAVSYGIIQRHGGSIEVQSEVEKGSTFTVHLPVHQAGGETAHRLAGG